MEKQSLVLALGNFDGVHLGHQQLLRQGKEIAASLGVPLYALLFDPHPLKVLKSGKPMNFLSDQATKICWLEECGVDGVGLMPFDRALADTPPRDFARLLVSWGAAHAVVGFNYTFGSGGQGKPDDLRRFGQECGFGVSVVQAQKLGQKIISSTAIRKSLLAGDLAPAAAMLGRSPIIKGRVTEGDKRGRALGFPTANLTPPEDILVPQDGVYAIKGLAGGRRHDGMLNIGVRPTFGAGLCRTIEAHFFELDADLYGQEITVTLEARLRGERKFESAAEISAQLARDREDALRCLKECGI
jgi:riboflavin kinase/FMN adenylyltransferase